MPKVKKGKLATPEVKPEPPPSPISSQHHHVDCGDDFAMLVTKVTDLATQSHVGYACACDYVPKIVSSRFPGRKTTHASHNQLASTMGYPLPSKKYPLIQQVSRPPPYQTTHSSSLTLGTRCLLGTSPRWCARTPEIVELARNIVR